MEQFEVHYWDTDGEPQVAIVAGDYGHDAAEAIEDMGRLGWIRGLGEADGEEPNDEPEDEGDESESDEDDGEEPNDEPGDEGDESESDEDDGDESESDTSDEDE